jgi:UPF0755 protein
MKKHLFLFLVVAPLISFIMVGVKIYYDINVWSYKGEEVAFSIRPGEGFASVNGRLINQKLIRSAKLFHRYAQFKRLMTSFKTGDYVVKPGMTMVHIMNMFVEGRSITIAVTIPEGRNIFEIAEILKNSEIIDSTEAFIATAKDAEFVQSLGVPAERIEGYLFPDTYQFSKQMNAGMVIRAMVRTFEQKTSQLDFTHPFLKNKHDIVILASMVEKETGAAWERPRIAGVFLNRLKKPMRLQSDPTTIYGIWEGWDGNLRRRNLQEVTPYNTYRINGLPKGPIANPGLLALQAVLEPEEHGFYYFVSKNDGTHIFSTTYKDHRAAVEEWQKNPANRRGRSWRDLQNKDAQKEN